MSGAKGQSPENDAEFIQCPHESIRATCGAGGCNRPCDPCAPARAIPPARTKGD